MLLKRVRAKPRTSECAGARPRLLTTGAVTGVRASGPLARAEAVRSATARRRYATERVELVRRGTRVGGTCPTAGTSASDAGSKAVPSAYVTVEAWPTLVEPLSRTAAVGPEARVAAVVAGPPVVGEPLATEGSPAISAALLRLMIRVNVALPWVGLRSTVTSA